MSWNMSRKFTVESTRELYETGERYLIRSDWHGYGELIRCSGGELILRFGNSFRPRWMLYGYFKMPDFVITDKAGSEIFRFRPSAVFSRSVFEVVAGSSLAGQVKVRFKLGWRYELTGPRVPRWTINMPLFTVRFSGVSDAGHRVVFTHANHREWVLLVTPGGDTDIFLATMAFVVREYLRHQ